MLTVHPTNSQPDEELSIYVERMIRMLHLITIYEDVLRKPKTADSFEAQVDPASTMMAVVYSFYYSLIETSSDGVSFFRVWRRRAPTFAAELDDLERRVEVFRDDLRIFRNRFGFHGSTTRKHESTAFELLLKHSGDALYRTIIDTRNLSTRLIEHVLSEPLDAPSLAPAI